MPTPRPFSVPTSFIPRFTPEGLLQRSQQQAARDAQVAAARINPPSTKPAGTNPLSFLGSLFNPLSPAGSILSLTGLEGSTPGPVDSPARRAAIAARVNPAQYAADSGVFGRYGAENVPFKIPGTAEESSAAPVSTAFSAASSSASERAYLEEKNRAAQLAAQDVLAKKYRVADLTKAYNAATGDEKERLGLEIWATTNPRLAQKLKPGELGYQEATSAFTSQSPLGAYVKSTGDMQFADKFTLPSEPPATSGFALQTPLTNIEMPAGLKQVGVSEKFADVSPAVMQAATMGYSDPLKLFKPDLTQTQQALLKQAFEKGLK